jgi:glycosyltransferase involved in cell wall biosynthesis
LRRWAFLTLLRLADYVIVVNREVEQLLHELEVSSTVVRISNGVDTSVFKAPTRDKDRVRKQLNLGTDKTLLLYVGRLDLETKDIDTLIHAWNLLPKEVRLRAQLIIVGNGPDHQKLASMISSLGLEESVLMVGEKQEVRDYYWASDVFALPSRDEGLSNALLEAMACELPVVASSVGGTPDIVGDCDNGFLYEARNDKQLAEKIMQVLSMEEEWAAIGARGRDTVLRTADIVLVAEQLDAVYQSLRASLDNN